MTSLQQKLTLPCGLELRDRIAMAPLTNTQSHADGTLSDDELRWLLRRARDGFRWISTCAAFVSEEGHAWKGQLGIASDDHLPGLTRLADALRAQGASSIVQLHHGGVQAKLAPDGPLGPVADEGKGIRAATASDIGRITADFVRAARRAERAGFAGVEIHGANGYIFTSFLALADNTRTDDYGGDLAGRARFLREVLQAVRDSVASSFAVGVRLSPVDVWSQRGLILDDSVQLGQWLAKDGADFIHLSLADAASPPPHEPGKGPVARAFRDALPANIPIFAAGNIWTREDADRARAAGVDVVVLGRAAIAHPDWPSASAAADWQPNKPTWDPAQLASLDVGPALVAYLSGFPGMIVGGKEARS